MAISAKDVLELRRQTDCGMMECKKALTQPDGDFEKAIEILREQGLATANKKAGRIAAEGMVYAVSFDNCAVVVEVNAETDFASNSDKFKEFVEAHPDHEVISYVNTSAAVKALTDVVVTSGNARRIVDSLPPDAKLIFGPDRNLGNYINSVTGRNMLLWDGACHVHERFSVEN